MPGTSHPKEKVPISVPSSAILPACYMALKKGGCLAPLYLFYYAIGYFQVVPGWKCGENRSERELAYHIEFFFVLFV